MRTTKPLTDADCRNLKPDPAGKARRRIFDGHGLLLEVLPSGRKVWRLKYCISGRESLATFGDYPAVTLKAARAMRDEARGLLASGLDVNEHARRQREADEAKAAAGSFAAVAQEWYEAEIAPQSESYQATVKRMLEREVLPYLGRRPVDELTARELLDVLRRVKMRGAEETARRVRVVVGQVVRYAIRTGRAENDPTTALRGERRIQPKRHFAAFTEPADVARLMRAIEDYRGTPEVRALVKLSALLFQRPGELRHMEWSQIDFQAAQWRYVVSKTQRRSPQTHIVPLSRQAVAILKDLQPLTDRPSSLRPDLPNYCFPSAKTRTRPASENAVRQALRNMGFTNDEMTAHGFRAMARSLLSEQGWSVDAIERQLSHKPRGPLGGAYDRAQFLSERTEMMQSWADYLEALARGADVVPIRPAKKRA